MDLIQVIKQARFRKRRPFPRTSFDIVCALVQEHRHGQSFLDALDNSMVPPAREWADFEEPKAKDPFEPPLFALATEEEYRLTQAIVEKIDNPYLLFAHSPEELLLSRPLFSLNPNLGPETLARVHFDTLLRREILRSEVERQASQEALLERLEDYIHKQTHQR